MGSRCLGGRGLVVFLLLTGHTPPSNEASVCSPPSKQRQSPRTPLPPASAEHQALERAPCTGTFDDPGRDCGRSAWAAGLGSRRPIRVMTRCHRALHARRARQHRPRRPLVPSGISMLRLFLHGHLREMYLNIDTVARTSRQRLAADSASTLVARLYRAAPRASPELAERDGSLLCSAAVILSSKTMHRVPGACSQGAVYRRESCCTMSQGCAVACTAAPDSPALP